jgi:hypothetical protein
MDIVFYRLTLIVYLVATAGFLYFIIKKKKKVGSYCWLFAPLYISGPLLLSARCCTCVKL